MTTTLNTSRYNGFVGEGFCMHVFSSRKGEILWTGSFDKLQAFVEETINLTGGKWLSPGGDAKLYQNQATAIKWYGNSKTRTP